MKTQIHIPILIKNILSVIGAFQAGFYFTTLFHEPTSLVGGLWAVISAIIILEVTDAETYNSAKNRIIGTFIGAVVSGTYLFFFSFTFFGYLVAIVVGVLVCIIFGVPQSVKLSGITISVVMIVSTIAKDLHPFINAGLRFVESAIGMGVAIAVSFIYIYIENRYFKKKL